MVVLTVTDAPGYNNKKKKKKRGEAKNLSNTTPSNLFKTVK